ncbi:MAG: protein-S-isoprenylcysteine O-methyltransferase [Pseudomonadota bacterium]
MRWIGALVAVALLAALIWRLPINGWGSLCWFVYMAVMGAIRGPFEAASKTESTSESRQTTLENALLFGVSLGAAFLPAAHLATGVLVFADYAAPAWVPAIGIPLAALGLWLFWRSHTDLGRHWSVTLELRDEHQLVTNGVYRYMRHPMYSAIFLCYIAQALFIQNWIAGFSGLVAFGTMYLVRARTEEAMMRAQFGDAYERYCASTPRLLPRLSASS